MKKSQAVLLVAVILVGIGAWALIGAFSDSSATTEFTIPTGEYYYRFESSTLINGETHGSYKVTSGDSVTMFVFSESEYANYEDSGLGEPLNTTTGYDANFSAELSGMDKIYLVFEHASGSNETKVQLTYTISGIAVTYLAGGIILLAAGLVLALVSFRFRSKEVRTAPPSPVATDVTLFKDQKPPQ
jgi:hypothetical protein